MRRIRTALTALAVVVSCAGTAQAALVNNGDGTITDDASSLMWMQDGALSLSNDFGVSGIGPGQDNMTWDTAQDWIAAMNAVNYKGYNDWRLPVCLDGSCSQHEMKTVWETSLGNAPTTPWESGNSGPFTNLGGNGWHSMWIGTAASATDAWLYLPGSGEWTDAKSSAYGIGAWPVRDVSAVPLPAAVWLFGSALAGMGLVRRKHAA